MAHARETELVDQENREGLHMNNHPPNEDTTPSESDNPPDDEIDVGSDSSTTKRDHDYAAEATDSSGDTASGGGDQPA
jgi:hypothetical protein